jgi:alpha-N-arabinofuranosidase
MYTSVKDDTILPVTTDSGTYSVAGGVRPLANIDNIPYIDVVATRSSDGKILTLLCVNRSLEGDIPTTFDLGSLKATGKAKMQQIKSTSRYEQNDEVEPRHVVPLDGSVEPSHSGALSVTLPHESVTVIRVPVR